MLFTETLSADILANSNLTCSSTMLKWVFSRYQQHPFLGSGYECDIKIKSFVLELFPHNGVMKIGFAKILINPRANHAGVNIGLSLPVIVPESRVFVCVISYTYNNLLTYYMPLVRDIAICDLFLSLFIHVHQV